MLGGDGARKEQYFPSNVGGWAVEKAASYLYEVKEPSLFARTRNQVMLSYREFGLMDFGDVLLIRVDIDENENGALFIKNTMSSMLFEDRQVTVSNENMRHFLELFYKCHFMDVPFSECKESSEIFVDGVIASFYEAVEGEKYHMFVRERVDATPVGDERFQEFRFYLSLLCGLID